jgi:serine/threonine-protein kinase
MVMEYLEGIDFSDLRRERGTFGLVEAVDYVLQACDALAEAHDLGIVHRDLKPSNLFLAKRRDGREVVKVLDFGISKLVTEGEGDTTQAGTMLGSPKYMAPEQMLSMSDVDARSDIWSLAAILYEFLTGRAPFHADTTPRVCALVLAADPTPPRMHRADVPREIEAIILRCLQKERANRIPTVEELAAALRPFSSQKPSLAAYERISHHGGDASLSHRSPLAASGALSPGDAMAQPPMPFWSSDTRVDRVPLQQPASGHRVAFGMTAGIAVPLLATAYMALRTPSVAAPDLEQDRPAVSAATAARTSLSRSEPALLSTSDAGAALVQKTPPQPEPSAPPSGVRPAPNARPLGNRSPPNASIFGWTSTSDDVSPFAPVTRTTPNPLPTPSGTVAKETEDPFQRSRW